MRRTKIVCTIGPATSTRRMLAGLLGAGMDVARLNFSHGDHDFHAGVIRNLRALSDRQARPLAILQDLSGPKVRLGIIPAGAVTLKRGQIVTFACDDGYGREDAVPLPAPELLSALSPGDRLLA